MRKTLVFIASKENKSCLYVLIFSEMTLRYVLLQRNEHMLHSGNVNALREKEFPHFSNIQPTIRRTRKESE